MKVRFEFFSKNSATQINLVLSAFSGDLCLCLLLCLSSPSSPYGWLKTITLPLCPLTGKRHLQSAAVNTDQTVSPTFSHFFCHLPNSFSVPSVLFTCRLLLFNFMSVCSNLLCPLSVICLHSDSTMSYLKSYRRKGSDILLQVAVILQH